MRRVGGRLPALAVRAVRRRRRPQRGLVHGLLGTALRQLRRGAAAPARADLPQPRPAAGLRPVLRRRAAAVLPGGEGGPAADHPGRSRHDELHRCAQARRRLPLGGRGGRRLGRRLPGPARRQHACLGGFHLRRHAVRPRRSAVAAAGAGPQRGQLAGPQRSQAAGADAAVELAGGRPGRRRGAVLPVAPVPGRRREVPLGDGPARWHRHPCLP